MRLLLLVLALVLGLAVGVAAVAVHRLPYGLALGLGSALVTMWTLRLWLAHAATLFAAGWLLPLLAAVTGRAEGDYAVSADLRGWLLIGAGLVVLVTGITWGRPLPTRRDSGSRAAPT